MLLKCHFPYQNLPVKDIKKEDVDATQFIFNISLRISYMSIVFLIKILLKCICYHAWPIS